MRSRDALGAHFERCPVPVAGAQSRALRAHCAVAWAAQSRLLASDTERELATGRDALML